MFTTILHNVFDSMGGAIGPIFGIIFYLLVVLAAVSSSISLLETVVAHFVDKAREEGKGDRRKKYSLIASILIALLCVLVCVDGLGKYFVNSVSQRDYTTIMGVTIFYAAFLMAMVLVVDLFYCLIDPRIKYD